MLFRDRCPALKLILAFGALLLLAAQCSSPSLSITGGPFVSPAPGQNVTNTFIVKNSGNQDAVLGSLEDADLGIASPFSLAGGTCFAGMTLAANGGECTLSILFSPTTTAAISETIHVAYSWADGSSGGTAHGVVSTTLNGAAGAGVKVVGVIPQFAELGLCPVPIGCPLPYSLGDSLGRVVVGTSSSALFSVTNAGAASVVLRDISLKPGRSQSTDGFSLSLGTCAVGQTLASGASCAVSVKFAPTTLIGGTIDLSVTYSFAANVPNQVAHREVYAFGVDPILTISDLTAQSGVTRYDFGAHTLGSSTPHTFTVTNPTGIPVTLGTISNASLGLSAPFSVSSGGTCTTGRVLAANGGSCTLIISFAPTVEETVSGSFALPYDFVGGSGHIALPAALTGSGGPPVLVAEGSAFDFGARPVGSVTTRTFNFKNIQGPKVSFTAKLSAPFSVVMSNCTGSFTDLLKIYEVSGYSSCYMVVAFAPTSQTAASGKLTLSLSWTDTAQRSASLGIALSGSGKDSNPVKQVSVGVSHTCALFASGSVRCWGMNDHGQLGYGNTNVIGDDEFPSSAGDVNIGGAVTQIAAGSDFTCALLASGNVRCWGRNSYGNLGYGNTNDIGDDELPASAGDVSIGGRVVQIAAKGFHACALLSTGKVRCWGQGGAGELGYGNTNDIGDDELPASAGDVNVGGTVTQIAAGDYYTCAILSGGALRCWGYAEVGRLGYGNTNNIGDDELPFSAGDVNVGGPVAQIALADHSCAVLLAGGVRCWGLLDNTSNWVGDDEAPATSQLLDFGQPVKQIDVTDGPSVNPGNNYALLADGTVSTWIGLQAGYAPPDFHATQVSGGAYWACAILASGHVRCWGQNYGGVLGYPGLDFGSYVATGPSPTLFGDVAVE